MCDQIGKVEAAWLDIPNTVVDEIRERDKRPVKTPRGIIHILVEFPETLREKLIPVRCGLDLFVVYDKAVIIPDEIVVQAFAVGSPYQQDENEEAECMGMSPTEFYKKIEKLAKSLHSFLLSYF